MWTQSEAIALCVKIESVCPAFGCHVALTGGALYKDGERKDLDILFYRIRQAPKIDIDGLKSALVLLGLTEPTGFGFILKSNLGGKPIDLLFPEEITGIYETAP